jgi:hypothetical protein
VFLSRTSTVIEHAHRREPVPGSGELRDRGQEFVLHGSDLSVLDLTEEGLERGRV